MMVQLNSTTCYLGLVDGLPGISEVIICLDAVLDGWIMGNGCQLRCCSRWQIINVLYSP